MEGDRVKENNNKIENNKDNTTDNYTATNEPTLSKQSSLPKVKCQNVINENIVKKCSSQELTSRCTSVVSTTSADTNAKNVRKSSSRELASRRTPVVPSTYRKINAENEKKSSSQNPTSRRIPVLPSIHKIADVKNVRNTSSQKHTSRIISTVSMNPRTTVDSDSSVASVTSVDHGSQTSGTIPTVPTQPSPSSIAIGERKSSSQKPIQRLIATVPIVPIELENEDDLCNQSNINQIDGGDSVAASSDEGEDSEDESSKEESEGTNEEHVSVLEETMDEDVSYEDTDDDQDEEEDSDVESDHINQVIPVHISNRIKEWKIEPNRNPVRKTIQTNPRIEASLSLPTIAVTNFRSLSPKINNVKIDLAEREIDILLGSETWQKDSNRRLKAEIETMFEMDGLEFLSCPRPSSKRGGGCAIIVNIRKFTVEKLQVAVPHKLEIVWCLVRPKDPATTNAFREIISCAFYSPPNYRKNAKLIEHIISQMHYFLVKFPRAGYICGGDKNKMPINSIEDALPKCRQIVTKYTYKNRKIHDVILTNMSHLYALPYIAPAVQPDVMGHGVPSDHNMAVAVPLAGAEEGAVTRAYTTKTSRPFPESGLRNFGLWIAQEEWQQLESNMSSTQQDQILKDILQNKVNEYFPEKQVRMSNTDKPWVTKDIKKLDRWKKNEYKKHGKTRKYSELQNAFQEKKSRAEKLYLNKNVTELMEAAPGRAWATLKRMGAQPGECGEEGSFELTEHVELNLTVEQSLDRIVRYFSAISSQHPPLNENLLPERVQQKLSSPIDPSTIPVICAQDVWQIQQGRHKTQSSVPGEFPPRLRYEFDVELSEPRAIIFNNITRTGNWCQDWLTEYGTPLKKDQVPKNEESLRIIAITNHGSITYERFVLKWLLTYVGDKLDPDQFGGQKGHSVAHYLIDIQNAILYNQDLKKPVATIFSGIDISKGFNRIEHNKCITKLSDMGCPNWLLRILISYLTNRKLIIRWKGKESQEMPLDSGAGQGTILGLFLFCITFNGAGPKPRTEQIGDTITKPKNIRKPITEGKKKWVDDLTITVPVKLNETLVPDTRTIVRPTPYHNRTGHMLPEHKNQMQTELNELKHYCVQNGMDINKKKSKSMIFNRGTSYDVMPELSVSDGEIIEVVEEMKLVGYMIRSDLKTISNTNYIVRKAYKKMWIIRRLKAMGASPEQMLPVLRAQVLSTLNFASPAWSTMLSKSEKSQIESVLKTGLYLVYGPRYRSFNWALNQSQMVSLEDQRKKAFIKFTKDCTRSDKFKGWFSENKEAVGVQTRSERHKYKEVPVRTKAFAKSAIPQMVKEANIIAQKSKLIILNSGQVLQL